MTESWRQLMNVGLVHFMAYPEGDPVQQIRDLGEDDFFDVVEIKPYDDKTMQQIKSICDTAGLDIGIGAQPGLLGDELSLNDQDEAGRKQAIESVKGAIDAGYDMDAKIVACLSGPMPDDEDDIATEMELMVDSCVQLCEYAQQQADDEPLWVSVEQFDDLIDKECLIGPVDLTAQLATEVKKQVDNFGLTIDLSHTPMLEAELPEVLGALGEHMIHAHAGNCVIGDESAELYGDLHPHFGYPGGENDVNELREYLEQLVYVGYFQNEVPTDRPVFTFEVKPYGDQTPELVIANTKRAFQRAWALV